MPHDVCGEDRDLELVLGAVRASWWSTDAGPGTAPTDAGSAAPGPALQAPLFPSEPKDLLVPVFCPVPQAANRR